MLLVKATRAAVSARALRLCCEAPDDRDVELDDVGLQRQQVAEAGVPGPEVIGRQPSPLPGAAGATASVDGPVVLDRRVLGQLDDEPA